MHSMWGKGAALAVALVVIGSACSSDDGGEDATEESAPAEDTTTTTATTEAASGVDPARAQAVVEQLADDSLEGRDNQTPGSESAQNYLVEQLAEFTDPIDGDSLDGYGHTFGAGTNLIGLIPGGERADEYLVLGGHYDHLGTACATDTPGDVVCNGAADNAAGVASVLEIGRALAADPDPSARSVVVALWDAEEDGLLGAEAYVDEPAVPLEDTIAYLNWDLQGANLSPSLTDLTVVVGAETGGPNLIAASEAAAATGTLETLDLSLLFGQGRSDHAVFAEAEVPVVFFTDANNACYHTSQDDLTTVDFDKLAQQIPPGEVLARDLATTDAVPEFDASVPAASFQDAVSMLAVMSGAQPDLARFPPETQRTAEQYLADLEAMVDAGEAAFDDAAVSTLLGGAVEIVEALTLGECTGFVD